jgi:hypothetical protein
LILDEAASDHAAVNVPVADLFGVQHHACMVTSATCSRSVILRALTMCRKPSGEAAHGKPLSELGGVAM